MKTNRQRILMILAGVVLAFLVGDKLVYTPLKNLWQSREQEIAKLNTQIKNGKALLRREEYLRETWTDWRKNTLPNNQSAAQEQLLQSIEEWAQDSNVSINGTAPQWKVADDDYRTLNYHVDASGSLWQLCSFIYHIEKGPMGLRLDSVEITSTDNSGQMLRLGLQISGLVLTPQTR